MIAFDLKSNEPCFIKFQQLSSSCFTISPLINFIKDKASPVGSQSRPDQLKEPCGFNQFPQPS